MARTHSDAGTACENAEGRCAALHKGEAIYGSKASKGASAGLIEMVGRHNPPDRKMRALKMQKAQPKLSLYSGTAISKEMARVTGAEINLNI